jgi:hypothetical protein
VEAREAGTDLLGEIESFAAHDEVVLVDAVVGLAGARRVAVIDERAFLQWPDTSPGSHTVSPLLAVKLFRTLHPGARTRFRLVALHAAGLDRRQPLTASVVADGVTALAGVLDDRQEGGTPVDTDAAQAITPPFQVCGSCRARWARWEDFVVDPRVELLGLQAVPILPDASLLIFEHGCGSSVSILTKRLRHLLPDDPASRGLPSLRGTEHCPGHCLSLKDMAACDRPCVNARDRELIKIVRRLRETGAGPVPASPAAAG